MVFRYIKITTLFLIFTSCLSTTQRQDVKIIEHHIDAQLRNGDLAFRRGRGLVSDAVVTADRRGNYSHIGIVVEKDDKWCVVHQVPYEGEKKSDDKIYCQPIEVFFNDEKAKIGAIYRTKADSNKVAHILNYLDDQLAKQTPFDHNFDLEDSTQMYCTELVWRAYQLIGIDLTEGRRSKILMPGMSNTQILPLDIEMNEDLELIYRF